MRMTANHVGGEKKKWREEEGEKKPTEIQRSCQTLSAAPSGNEWRTEGSEVARQLLISSLDFSARDSFHARVLFGKHCSVAPSEIGYIFLSRWVCTVSLWLNLKSCRCSPAHSFIFDVLHTGPPPCGFPPPLIWSIFLAAVHCPRPPAACRLPLHSLDVRESCCSD